MLLGQQKQNSQQRYEQLAAPGAILAAALALLYPAILNGFPLAFSDSGTYIRVVIEGILPADRPVHYALLVFLLHKISGLWGVIFFQSLTVSYVLWLTFRAFFGHHSLLLFLASVCCLSLVSSMPWFSAQLMPDIFSAVMILAIAVFLAHPLPRRHRIALLVLLVIVAPMHVSHFVIWAGMLLAALLHDYQSRRSLRLTLRRHAALLSACLLAIVLLLSPQLAVNRTLAVSQASNVMLLAKLIDQGIGLRYLDASCPTTQLPVCRQLPALHTVTDKARREGRPIGYVSDDFLWNGPLDQLGGFAQVSRYASAINRGAILAEPGAFAQEVLSGFIHQLPRYRIGDALPALREHTSFYESLNRYYPAAIKPYLTSIQYQGWGNFDILNDIFKWTLLVSLIVSALCILTLKHRTLRLWAGLVACGIAANALVTGGLSAVHDRYGSRVSWTIVLVSCICLMLWLRERYAVDRHAYSVKQDETLLSPAATLSYRQ